jgi:hypothetical protein
VKNRYQYVKNALIDKPLSKPGEKYNKLAAERPVPPKR